MVDGIALGLGASDLDADAQITTEMPLGAPFLLAAELVAIAEDIVSA